MPAPKDLWVFTFFFTNTDLAFSLGRSAWIKQAKS